MPKKEENEGWEVVGMDYFINKEGDIKRDGLVEIRLDDFKQIVEGFNRQRRYMIRCNRVVKILSASYVVTLIVIIFNYI